MRKLKKSNVKVANSSKVGKERMFHVHVLVESVCIILCTNAFYDKVSDSALFLTFDQISGMCAYRIVLLKEVYYRDKNCFILLIKALINFIFHYISIQEASC